MNSISVMELNTKSPYLWDLDNLVLFPSRPDDVPKKLQLVDSGFETTIEGFELGTFHSSGGRSDGGSGSGCASDLGYVSSSKSTKSASVDSSSYKEIRESKFTLGASDLDFSQDQSNRKGSGSGSGSVSAWPTRTPSMTDVSIGSGDSLIGLKLGKRTYFEDVSASNTGKRSKLSSQGAETLRCQVEGCNLDLSSAKGYHRKHRVCESHSKSPKVVICGVERRFCQQCSRFHSLSEFDQKKRSCRRRLSDHNARRRKPAPDVIQFNSMRLPSSLHEGRNQISLAFNQVPMVQTRPNSNATWDFTTNSNITQEKLGLFSPKKPGGIDSLQVPPQNEPHETGFKLSYESTQLMSPNGTTAEVFHQGYQMSATTNNMNTGPELRALSLLSTNSWGSCSQEPLPPPQQPPQLDQSSLIHNHHNYSHDMPSISAEYWPSEQQQAVSSFSPQRNATTNPSQEFQLFRAPNEPGFYSYEGLR